MIYDETTVMRFLKQPDYLMLKEIYTMRCMSVKQAWLYFYKGYGITFNNFVSKRLMLFARLGIIEMIYSGSTYAIFVKTPGINILKRKFNITTEVWDIKTRTSRRGYHTEGELKMLPKLINHQLELNQFVFDFKEKHKTNPTLQPYKFINEKTTSKYKFIRPDGMISISQVDFFLEMDMGTETKKQLLDKWNNYRLFMNTTEFKNSESKIIVLFIISCPKDAMHARKNLIRSTIYETLIDAFDDRFDVYIGSRTELIGAVFEKLLPLEMNSYFFDNAVMEHLIAKKHGFTVGQGDKLKKVFYDASYGYYIRKINNKNRITIVDGKVQEFLFDEYFFAPLSVLNKLVYLKKNSSLFRINYKRDIAYVILVGNLKSVFNDLALNGLTEIQNVYFTTIEKLSNHSFHEALMSFDRNGNVYTHTSPSLKNKVKSFNLFD